MGNFLNKKKNPMLHSIQTKILIITLALTIGTTLVSMLISYYTEINTIRNTTESYMTQYIAFADERFNDLLSDVRKSALSVVTEQELYGLGFCMEKKTHPMKSTCVKKELQVFSLV